MWPGRRSRSRVCVSLPRRYRGGRTGRPQASLGLLPSSQGLGLEACNDEARCGPRSCIAGPHHHHTSPGLYHHCAASDARLASNRQRPVLSSNQHGASNRWQIRTARAMSVGQEQQAISGHQPRHRPRISRSRRSVIKGGQLTPSNAGRNPLRTGVTLTSSAMMQRRAIRPR
jgi:hypothetical protein